jgi:nitronate monooxygenase
MIGRSIIRRQSGDTDGPSHPTIRAVAAGPAKSFANPKDVAMSDLLARLGIDHPIILAPMGGGPCTPELIAAVSNAGGLGSLAAAYLPPAQIARDIERVRQLTDKPFNVNLFAGGYDAGDDVDPAPMLSLLKGIHDEWQLPPPVLPAPSPNPFPDQVAAVLESRPAVFSFTFGIPDQDTLTRFRKLGIPVLGTATSLEEARLLEEAGVDGVVAQGAEAGAHRGSFATPFDEAMIPTLDLVCQTASALKVPVIASGGLMDGNDIAEAMRFGAAAVQLGTAFLTCPESGASETYKKALLGAKADTTVITRAFSGRPARGLRNRFIAQLEGKEDIVPEFPTQNTLTRAMRAEAARRGEEGYLSLWAGRGVPRIRLMPAAELMQRLIEEMSQSQPHK